MPSATVLIPTHDHADTIAFALRSVLGQTEQDFEVFVVGDGAPPRTREVVAPFLADPRIRYFDNPKGERHGERHRHVALQEARGEIVCYCGDDDIWMPDHLRRLSAALREVDFAHTVTVIAEPDGTVRMQHADLADPRSRQAILNDKHSFFGLTTFGHTLDAYRRLPFGWRPAPKGIWTDLYMYQQMLAQPWMRARTVARPTTIKLAAGVRRDLSTEQRVAELASWDERMHEPGFADWLWEQVLQDAMRRALAFDLKRRNVLWRALRHYRARKKLGFS